MRSVVVMFDSLNRHMLSPYGCEWTHTPNFKRLAERTATFERSYVCSMPCMPARRELHTGRPNFLHRSWGPIEPFDDSVPEMLREAGVHTHLATDHQHYWEDGGGTYHTRFQTFDLVRGQEGDPWVGQCDMAPITEREIILDREMHRQDMVNREVTGQRESFPMHVTFDKGLEFIQRNHESSNWMLQLETFDPHEPFFSLDDFREPFREHFEAYKGKPVEWPPYREVREPQGVVEHARYEYASLLNGCDKQLGRVLDLFDSLDLWKDTMLIVCTDHGFMLGEHDCWAKCWAPFYNEIANTPFFVWDPRSPEAAGQRRRSLVQPSIDIGPTLLDFHGLAPTEDMTGKTLGPVVADDTPIREFGIFGIFGGHVNITDGDYVYMRGPQQAKNEPLYDYTLMPTRMRRRFTAEEMRKLDSLAEPFPFTKGCKTMKIPGGFGDGSQDAREFLPTQLFDVSNDPGQVETLEDDAVESRMIDGLITELRRHHAPPEQFERLGLPV
ncbi:MAG: sulfatase [Puniceicoccales bacterium]